MGSYYVVSKNGQHQTFIGAGGLDQALRFAAGEGSIWKMTKEDVIRKGLSNPKTAYFGPS